MSAVPKPRYTLEEYFALELESELKYEYWHGEVFVMSGASPTHERIFGNLFADLGNYRRRPHLDQSRAHCRSIVACDGIF
jgi:Uma2 family endonuclease